MRFAFVLPLMLGCGLALPALAQSAAPPADPHVQTIATAAKTDPSPTQARRGPSDQEEQAAAALAMSIRQREIEEQRIARIACAAGDTSKCQAANDATTARTPSP